MSGHFQYRWEELYGDDAVSCPKLEGVVGSAKTRGREVRGNVEIGRTFDGLVLVVLCVLRQ